MIKKMAVDNCSFLNELSSKVLSGGAITWGEAQGILSLSAQEEVMMLLAHATQIRNHFKGTAIDLCAIVNAKSGRCSEDCVFCAQSAHYKADIQTYPLRDTNKIIEEAEKAKHNGARRFSMVISGKSVTTERELETVCEAIRIISQRLQLLSCASLGILSREQLHFLHDAGLTRYHHNLETAESYFPSICSTHTFKERVDTIVAAQREGFEVCAGGVFGIGETPEQRIELAFTLRELEVDSVPLNFLIPIAGTPAEKYTLLPPLEILKIIALFRLVHPLKDIRICGGREVSLRTLQPLMYLAGASGTMVGNYLTTSGRDPQIDKQEIADLGFTVKA